MFWIVEGKDICQVSTKVVLFKRKQYAHTITKSFISDHLPHGPVAPYSPTQQFNMTK